MSEQELITKEFDFTAEIQVSIYDILQELDEEEKRQLLNELIEEIGLETENDETEVDIAAPSVEEGMKLNYLRRASKFYTLEEVEQRLPEKLGW